MNAVCVQCSFGFSPDCTADVKRFSQLMVALASFQLGRTADNREEINLNSVNILWNILL